MILYAVTRDSLAGFVNSPLDARAVVPPSGAMERKDKIDATGAVALIGFAVVLAFNQVVIKTTNTGFQPVFVAALRSIIALVVLLIWIKLRAIPIGRPSRAVVLAGILAGVLFSFEFVCLYIALDLTAVSRASIIFYSMPVFLALAAHFWIEGERLTPIRAFGLILAMAGVIWVLIDREGGQTNLWGDLAALGAALGWAGIALTVRITPLAREKPETQLLWQLAVSSVLLMAAAPFFGAFIRDLAPIHFAGLAFQVLAVASFGYLFWFFLMKRYPASGVASFSFLSPAFSVVMGWVILGEDIGSEVIGGLVLVGFGLVFINQKPRG